MFDKSLYCYICDSSDKPLGFSKNREFFNSSIIISWLATALYQERSTWERVLVHWWLSVNSWAPDWDSIGASSIPSQKLLIGVNDSLNKLMKLEVSEWMREQVRVEIEREVLDILNLLKVSFCFKSTLAFIVLCFLLYVNTTIFQDGYWTASQKIWEP